MEDDIMSIALDWIRARSVTVALLFWVGCGLLDIGWFKALVIVALVYYMHSCSFGARRLEQMAVLLIGLTVASWLDFPVKPVIAPRQSHGGGMGEMISLI